MSEIEPEDPFAEVHTSGAERWWMKARARLPFLVICLAATVFVLVRAEGGSPASFVGSQRGCLPNTPMLADVPIEGIVVLHADLLPAINLVAPRRYAAGIVAPSDFWSDDDPSRLRTSRLAGGRWAAGWEMRADAHDENVVGDVLQFADAATARRFLALASSGRCHPHATTSAAAAPAGASNLSWINPDGFRQEDVFLRDGTRVYRIGVVRAQSGPLTTQEQLGFAHVDRLACALPHAACPRRAT